MTSSADASNQDARDQDAPFGFRRVSEAEKDRLVRGVFDSVASRYDLMNDLMSLGVHRLWKDAMIDWLKPRQDMALIDVGGGTGDIAFRFLNGGGNQVTVTDINHNMLKVGRERAPEKVRHLNERGAAIQWVTGDAERLPYPDMSFDAFTTAFCLRNVTRLEDALREAHRVLKPGGRFLCLEFSKVALPALDGIYERYSFSVLPALGRFVAGDEESYQYLAESIRTFPDQASFKARIEAAGFGQASHRNLSGGIAALHSAWRL